MNPLLRELIRARKLAETPVGSALLARVGVEQTPRYWGVDWVEVDGPLYRPAAEGGRIALIQGVYQCGGLVDLLATSLETRAMRLRRGLGTVLGEDRIEHAVRYGKTLPVCADGISWLVNGRTGVVILDWSVADLELFEAPAVACETEALALRLKRTFAAGVVAAPPIFVPTGNTKECRHAA